MPQVKPGWHFYVNCLSCKKEIIFQEAPPPMEIKTPKVRPQTIVCPHCRAEHSYRAAQVRRGPD